MKADHPYATPIAAMLENAKDLETIGSHFDINTDRLSSDYHDLPKDQLPDMEKMIAGAIVAHNTENYTRSHEMIQKFDHFAGVLSGSNQSLEEMIAILVEHTDHGSFDFGRTELSGDLGFVVNTGDTYSDALCYLDVQNLPCDNGGFIYDLRQTWKGGVLFIGNAGDLIQFAEFVEREGNGSDRVHWSEDY